MKFFIFHGAFSKANGSWFPELKYRLESLDQKVYSIQYPCENEKELTESGPLLNSKDHSQKLVYSPGSWTCSSYWIFWGSASLEKSINRCGRGSRISQNNWD